MGDFHFTYFSAAHRYGRNCGRSCVQPSLFRPAAFSAPSTVFTIKGRRKKREQPCTHWMQGCSLGSGRRIRTLTYGVRVRCATFTQSRCVHNEQSLLYTSAAICQEQVFKIPINFSSPHACPLNPASAGAEGTGSAAAAYCCTAASSEADVAAARSCACWRSSIWVAVSWDASRSEISASRM